LEHRDAPAHHLNESDSVYASEFDGTALEFGGSTAAYRRSSSSARPQSTGQGGKQKLNDVVVARVWNDFARYHRTRNESFAAFSITRKCSAENRGMGATETVCEDVVGPAK
jgi:ectoine hydroxylase-related dioxygenase (phytanoyl-CoA dioxygenase family)